MISWLYLIHVHICFILYMCILIYFIHVHICFILYMCILLYFIHVYMCFILYMCICVLFYTCVYDVLCHILPHHCLTELLNELLLKDTPIFIAMFVWLWLTAGFHFLPHSYHKTTQNNQNPYSVQGDCRLGLTKWALGQSNSFQIHNFVSPLFSPVKM